MYSWRPYQEKTQENGKCVVHIDDNFDGRIEFSRIAPFPIQSPQLCDCSSLNLDGCRYSDDGVCLYDLTVQYLGNQQGPWKYECEIINDGKRYFNNSEKRNKKLKDLKRTIITHYNNWYLIRHESLWCLLQKRIFSSSFRNPNQRWLSSDLSKSRDYWMRIQEKWSWLCWMFLSHQKYYWRVH